MSPALCQWSEVMNHPGLVCCVQQTTGIPLVIMVKPDNFLVQEIKTLPAKAKVSSTWCTQVSMLCHNSQSIDSGARSNSVNVLLAH